VKYNKSTIIILSVVIAGYTVWETVNFVRKRIVKKTWTTEQKKETAARMIKSSKHLSQADSVTAWNVANCFVEKTIATYSYDEIMAMEGKSPAQLEPLFEELVKECMTQFFKIPPVPPGPTLKK
jgi:hypothetical protein